MAGVARLESESLLIHCCYNRSSVHLRLGRIRAISHWHWASRHRVRCTLLGVDQSVVSAIRKRDKVLVRRLSDLAQRNTDLRRQERRQLLKLKLHLRHPAEPNNKNGQHASEGHLLPTHLPVPEQQSVCLWLRKLKRLRLQHQYANLG